MAVTVSLINMKSELGRQRYRRNSPTLRTAKASVLW